MFKRAPYPTFRRNVGKILPDYTALYPRSYLLTYSKNLQLTVVCTRICIHEYIISHYIDYCCVKLVQYVIICY